MNPELRPEFAVDRLRVEFSQPETERDFQRHHLNRNQASLRVTLIFCAAFFVAFAVTDVAAVGYSYEALVLLLARILFAATAMVGLYALRVRPDSIATPVLVASTAEIVGMTTFMLIVWLRSNEIAGPGASLCVMLVILYVFVPNRLIIATGIALAATAAFIVIAVARQPATEVLTTLMRLILANGVGLVAARRYQRLWRDEYRVLMDYKQLSIRDHLTGCYNRRHLHGTVLPTEIARARRHRLWLTLLVCDVDHFKSINDTYGHQAGDAVLRHLSAVLQGMTRQHLDSVVRYGGEEFLLVLTQTDLGGAVSLAERLREAIAGNPTVNTTGQSIAATASFGVLSINFATAGMGATEESLFAAADNLLYAAKQSGRNTIRVEEWSDMSPIRRMNSSPPSTSIEAA